MNHSDILKIYTAQFPFLDTQEVKVRPVIAISPPQGKHNVVAIIPVSSKPKREAVDIVLSRWQSEGLAKPSVARVHRITTILQADLLTELGRLDSKDAKTLKASLRDYLDL